MSEGDKSAALPQFKKFVSETEVEEKKQKRQEEWERVRKPQDPIEVPAEEPEDNRSLYDRLQEQKNQKQAEHDDKFLLKNQVRGLDDEEAHFLDEVNRQQEQRIKEKEKEEEDVLAEYRSSRAGHVAAQKASAVTPRVTSSSIDTKQRPTQSQLLSGAVKRKRTSNSGDESPKEKEAKPDSQTSGDVEAGRDVSPKTGSLEAAEVIAGPAGSSVAVVVGVLPGIGIYTDSDSDSNSSTDSDDIDTDIFRRAKIVVQDSAH